MLLSGECVRDFNQGLLVIADDALWFGKLEGQELERAKKTLAEGAAPEAALEDEASRWQLRFRDLKGINFNQRHAQMHVEYPGEKEDPTSTFNFDDYDASDEAFKDIRCRLGRNWKLERRDLNRFQASFAPLLMIGALALIFGFFVFLAWAIQQPAEGGRRVVRTNIWGLIAAYPVGWLGPRWTGAIGGVCVALAVAWMAVCIADPPIEITLKPKPVTGDEDDFDEERPRNKRKQWSRDDAR